METTAYKHWQNVAKPDDFCFITTTIECFVPILGHQENAKMVLRALDFYRRKYSLLILGYVVMPEHLHAMLKLEGGICLSKLMADFKRYTSKQMLDWCRRAQKSEWLQSFTERGAADGEAHSVWQRSFRSVPVLTEHDALVKLSYIHNNPVKRGLVALPEQWPYSSANAYADAPTVIRVDML